MFVWTAKVSKTKLAALVTGIIAVIVLAAVISAAKQENPELESAAGDTNDARITFLAQFGWEVNGEPVQTQTVSIPTEDSEVFSRYNELQKSQGYDLTQYAGKRVSRYVYEILNYPDASAPVYATVFVHAGKIIGGDVTNTAPEGAMHGFTMP